jgi:hypothetical protein
MRRVGIHGIYRESGLLRARYEKNIEKHLGVTNPNGVSRVGLVGPCRYTGALSMMHP